MRASRIRRAALVLILLLHASPALAQTPPRTLTVGAFDDAHQPAATLHAGERLVLRGALAPATPGEPVTVTVTLDGRPWVQRAVPVDGGGAFRLAVSPARAGALAATATTADAASSPVAVAVRLEGRPARSCWGAATLTSLKARRPPRVADGALHRGALLAPGALIRVRRPIRLRRRGATYRFARGRFTVACRALELDRGRVRVVGRGSVLLGPALATVAHGRLEARRGSGRFDVVRGRGHVTSSADPRTTLDTVAGDTALLDRHGLVRLDTWPFAQAPDQRRVPRGSVPAYWADGAPCATGCRPAGALTGWPLKPFRRQHPLRAGLNEWRPANMHIGIDIQALDGTPVYALQNGRAGIAGRGTVDIRVLVGAYEYWHVVPSVREGAYVRAHRTVIGHVVKGAGHLHLSEGHGDYLNPMRPGGRVLAPYRDALAPVIGSVHQAGGEALVEAFDPQSLRRTIRYRTPVLAPAAVAWRARDARGRALTPLVFAYRGSHHYPTAAKPAVYGPGTTPPTHRGAIAGGWACFWAFEVCVPKWSYRLPGVPAGAAAVTVYAWDWAGNVAMRTTPLAGRAEEPAAAPPAAGASKVD
jgi:hypothetical protein